MVKALLTSLHSFSHLFPFPSYCLFSCLPLSTPSHHTPSRSGSSRADKHTRSPSLSTVTPPRHTTSPPTRLAHEPPALLSSKLLLRYTGGGKSVVWRQKKSIGVYVWWALTKFTTEEKVGKTWIEKKKLCTIIIKKLHEK